MPFQHDNMETNNGNLLPEKLITRVNSIALILCIEPQLTSPKKQSKTDTLENVTIWFRFGLCTVSTSNFWKYAHSFVWQSRSPYLDLGSTIFLQGNKAMLNHRWSSSSTTNDAPGVLKTAVSKSNGRKVEEHLTAGWPIIDNVICQFCMHPPSPSRANLQSKAWHRLTLYIT